jgi:hypothetical protein
VDRGKIRTPPSFSEEPFFISSIFGKVKSLHRAFTVLYRALKALLNGPTPSCLSAFDRQTTSLPRFEFNNNHGAFQQEQAPAAGCGRG